MPFDLDMHPGLRRQGESARSAGRGIANAGCIILAGLFAFSSHATAQERILPRDYALTVYAGKLTDSVWEDTFASDTRLLDSRLLVAALSRTLHRAPSGDYSWEVEGQIGKHSGMQDHWEFNLLGALRWHRFPWSDTLRSSAAFGLGLSHASEVPEVESMLKGESEKLLAYWYMEVTLGPRDSDWQASLRLHHRSTAFHLLGDAGGSNALTLGIRYEFD
ncbi:MAG: hypothetical protein FJ209_00465 [Betaproteobacteria bacterium]|nr:hypothetical protein [Betaproteobacteria bacterium]